MKHALWVFLIGLAGMMTVQATRYYVASTGSDGASGLNGSPWATMGKGFSSVKAGDTLMLDGMTVNAAATFSTSGQPGKPIVITGRATTWTKQLTIAGNYIVLLNQKFNSAPNPQLQITGSNCRASHITITGNDAGFYQAYSFTCNGGSNDTLSYSDIYGASAVGVGDRNDGGAVINFVLDSCRIHDQAQAIVMQYAGECRGITISRCQWWNIDNYGADIEGTETQDPPVWLWDVKILQCQAWDCGRNPAFPYCQAGMLIQRVNGLVMDRCVMTHSQAWAGIDFYTCENLIITNSFFTFGVQACGIELNAPLHCEIWNNVFYGNESGDPNNFIIDQLNSGHWWPPDHGIPSNWNIVNNIIQNNSCNAVTLGTSTFKNNVYFSGGPCGDVVSGTISSSAATEWGGAKTYPGSPSAQNFSLVQGAKSINAGLTPTNATVAALLGHDYLGNARADGKIDIGPYEFGGQPTATMQRPPSQMNNQEKTPDYIHAPEFLTDIKGRAVSMRNQPNQAKNEMGTGIYLVHHASSGSSAVRMIVNGK